MAGPSDQALHWLAGWYAIALRLGGNQLPHRRCTCYRSGSLHKVSSV